MLFSRRKFLKIDSISLSISDAVFRIVLFRHLLCHVYVRLSSSSTSKKASTGTFTNAAINHCILCLCPKCNNNKYKYKLNSKTGKRRIEYITRTISLPVLPFPVPLGTTVCFTAFHHPKFSIQIFMELTHHTFKYCRQNVLFL